MYYTHITGIALYNQEGNFLLPKATKIFFEDFGKIKFLSIYPFLPMIKYCLHVKSAGN